MLIKKEKKERVSVTLDAEILKKIDSGRGLTPRATVVNELLKTALDKEGYAENI